MNAACFSNSACSVFFVVSFYALSCNSSACAEDVVIYECKYSPEVLREYLLVESESILPTDKSFEEHIREYQSVDFDNGRVTAKVVLLRRDGQMIARHTKLYGKIAVRDARKQWLPIVKKKLALDGHKFGFSATSITAWVHPAEARFLSDIDYVGEVESRLSHDDGTKIEVSIQQVPENKLRLHDLLCNVIHRELEIRETKHGVVIVGVGQESSWGAWRSGDNRMIFAYANVKDPMLLVDVIGGTFPSSLPKGLVIDKARWGREEARLCIALLDKIVNRCPQEPIDYFSLFLNRLSRHVYVPEMQNWRTSALESRNHAQVLAEVKRWWKDNEGSTYWSAEDNCLVAKGQTPRELAARAAEEPAREEEMRLATPLTREETEAADKALINFFDNYSNDLYKNFLTRRRDVTDVRLDRPDNSTVVMTYKMNGVRFVRTASYPKMRGSGTVLDPLFAESNVRLSEPTKDRQFVCRYTFDRDKRSWSLAEVKEQ